MPGRITLIRTIIGLLLATSLAACAQGGPRSPSQSVQYPWQDITPAQSAMVISGPEDHHHSAHKIGSRYQERVYFGSGASVFYEQLEGIHAVFGVAASDLIKSWYQGDSVRAAGFTDKGHAVRRTGEAFSVTDAGTNRTCSLYARVFGGTGYGGNGDQLYRIEYCVPSGADAAARADRVVSEIADRLQTTPQIAKAAPALLLNPAASAGTAAVATPAAATAPAARPSPPPQAAASGSTQPPEIDTICYSSRHASIYHAGACWRGDRPAPQEEVDATRAQYQFVTKAGRDEAPLTVPRPGTRIYNSIGGYREYVMLDGPFVVYKSANRRVLSSIGGIVGLSENESVPVDRIAALWPLEVGKSVAYINQGNTTSWDVQLEVLRRERVTVQAGSFDTFVVQEHQKGRGSNYHESFRTYWYSPAAGGLVKFDVKLLAGTTNLKPWEALSIAPPAAAPVPKPAVVLAPPPPSPHPRQVVDLASSGARTPPR
jgi:hypothetical protein